MAKTNYDFIDSLYKAWVLDNLPTGHVYCRCVVKPKLPEYPAVYAHVKYGGFNIGTICIANIQGKMSYGESLCSPEDQFSKKVGREIAYRRAYEGIFLDIPKEYRQVFDETYDYLAGIAERKLFGKKKFEEVRSEKEESKYPYLAKYAVKEGMKQFGGLKVLFVGENKAIVIKNSHSLHKTFRVGMSCGFYESMFTKISSEEL